MLLAKQGRVWGGLRGPPILKKSQVEFRKFKKQCKEMPWHIFPPQTVSDAKNKYFRCDAPQQKKFGGAGRGRGGGQIQNQSGAPKRK